MNKLKLLLATLCAWLGTNVSAQTMPVASTADNPKYYTFASYNRGGFLTDNCTAEGTEAALSHVAITDGSFWWFEDAGDGGFYMHSYAGHKLSSQWKTGGNTAMKVWVLPNGVNQNGVVICKNASISGSDCIDANNYDTGVGNWDPRATDWQGTTWVAKEAVMLEGVPYYYSYYNTLTDTNGNPLNPDKKYAMLVDRSPKLLVYGSENGQFIDINNTGTIMLSPDQADYYAWTPEIATVGSGRNLYVILKNAALNKYILQTNNVTGGSDGGNIKPTGENAAAATRFQVETSATHPNMYALKTYNTPGQNWPACYLSNFNGANAAHMGTYTDGMNDGGSRLSFAPMHNFTVTVKNTVGSTLNIPYTINGGAELTGRVVLVREFSAITSIGGTFTSDASTTYKIGESGTAMNYDSFITALQAVTDDDVEVIVTVSYTADQLALIVQATAILASMTNYPGYVGSYYDTNKAALEQALASFDFTALQAQVDASQPVVFSSDKRYEFVNAMHGSKLYANSETGNLWSSNKTGAEAYSETNEKYQWAVSPLDGAEDTYALYNIGTAKFVYDKNTNTNDSYAWNVGSEFSTEDGMYVVIAPAVSEHSFNIHQKGANDTYMYMHNSAAYDTGIVNWDAGTNGSASHWRIKEIDGESVNDAMLAALVAAKGSVAKNAAKAALANACATFKAGIIDSWSGNYRIGDGYNNYYGVAEADVRAMITDIETMVRESASTQQQYEDKLAELQTMESQLHINLPKAGDFIRMRCADGGNKYIQSTAEGNQQMQNARSRVSSIWYYDGNGILSYELGRYLGEKVLAPIGTSYEVVFAENSHNRYAGLYSINVKAGSGETVNDYLYGADDNLDKGDNLGNQTGYTWWLEEVTALPVTLNAHGFATLNLPVTVTIPDGVAAWYAESVSVENNTVSMKKISDGVLPANTPVILQGEESANLTFNVTDDATFDGTNNLVGTIAAIANPATEGTKTLVMGVADDKPGLYNYTGIIKGFKAYLPYSDGTSVRLVWGDMETAIEAVENSALQEGVMYNLNGQRVQKANGIVIVNGKKYIVK